VNEVRSALPEINAHAARDLQDLLQREGIKPAFRRVIERELRNLERGPAL
jgi:hypothetical protein